MADPSLDEILSQVENPAFVRVATARVLLRQDLVAKHAELEAQLAAAIARDEGTFAPNAAPALSKQILDLQAEMEAAKVEFVFANIGKRPWADLLAEHPPTKAQIAHFRENKQPLPDHNPETFPIAAMAASSRRPKMDETAVRRFEAKMTDSQFTQLWRACIDANLGGDAPKSLAASQILRANERSESSVSAGVKPSPEASSSVA